MDKVFAHQHHQLGTPYVTPHILHKSYAQSHDDDETSKCEFRFVSTH